MNPQQPSKLEPLTEEELKAVEADNLLLKIFSQWFEGMEEIAEKEGYELDGAMMFQAFTVGCSAVMKVQRHATMRVAVETHQLSRLLVTLKEAAQDETK